MSTRRVHLYTSLDETGWRAIPCNDTAEKGAADRDFGGRRSGWSPSEHLVRGVTPPPPGNPFLWGPRDSSPGGGGGGVVVTTGGDACARPSPIHLRPKHATPIATSCSAGGILGGALQHVTLSLRGPLPRNYINARVVWVNATARALITRARPLVGRTAVAVLE